MRDPLTTNLFGPRGQTERPTASMLPVPVRPATVGHRRGRAIVGPPMPRTAWTVDLGRWGGRRFAKRVAEIAARQATPLTVVEVVTGDPKWRSFSVTGYMTVSRAASIRSALGEFGLVNDA